MIAAAHALTSSVHENDATLLQRIEAELAFDAAATPIIGPNWPRRAAGSVEIVRVLEGGEECVSEALMGRPALLRRALFTEDIAHLPHTLVHHIAVLHAWALEQEATSEARLVSLRGLIACWLVLGEDGAHLRAAAHAASASEEHTERLLLRLRHRGLDEVESRARMGLHACTPEGEVAIRALRSLPALTETLPLSDESKASAVMRAQSTIDMLASQWTAVFRDALEEGRARDQKRELILAMTHAHRTWQWLGCEREVERQVVIALPTIAWPIYRERQMEVLGEILEPVVPLFTALEARILQLREEGDVTTELAYLGPAAQALVFWSETTKDVALAMDRAERAYALCPTLRNARIVLSHLLCDRAERTLAQGQLWPTHPAKADVIRAREIFPELARLPGLMQRVGVDP